VERLTSDRPERTSKHEDTYRAKRMVNEVYDLKTGQQLYKPKISEISSRLVSEKRACNRRQKSIHEELYKEAEVTKQKDKKRILEER